MSAEPSNLDLQATTEEAADILRVTPKSIITWAHQGAPVVRKGRVGPGGSMIVIPRQLLQWLETRTRASRARDLMAASADGPTAKRQWREALLLLPGRIAPQLVGIQDETIVADILRRELHALLVDVIAK
jgi:hypothetical protein